MKKIPWGIFAGICAMIWSFVTIGLIAVFVVSATMIASEGNDQGLTQAWWMVLLYIFEAVSLLGFGVNLFFYVKRQKRLKKEGGGCK